MSTTVPAAITAIIAAFQSSSDLTGVPVSDGPSAAATAQELICVGYDGSGDVAVTVDTQPEGLGQSALERYDVMCAASVANGSDLPTARSRAYALYDACIVALGSDPTLGGVVMRAMTGNVSLHQSRTSRGVAATLTFSVSVEAFT